MHEDRIIEAICDSIQKKLASQNESRTFEYQTLLTGGAVSSSNERTNKEQQSQARKRTIQENDEDGDIIMIDSLPGTSVGKYTYRS
jgi:DNA mismatch repair protein MLH1